MKRIELLFADARNNIYLCLEKDVYSELMDAYNKKKSRYSFYHNIMPGDDKTKQKMHLDMNHVIGIKELP